MKSSSVGPIKPDEVEGYVRLSREDLRGPGSMEEKFAIRKQICLNLAKQAGWPLTEERIRWEQESGTKLLNRPEALAILNNVRTGKTRYLVTPTQERFLRGDKHDEQTVEDAFCDAGLLLLTTEGLMPFDENFATTHALLFGVKAAVARHYVADLVRKRRETDFIRLQDNIRCRGFAPYGYEYLRPTYDPHGRQLTPQRHHVIPAEYLIVAEIFRRVRTESVNRLAIDLNARGVPAPGGGAVWYNSTVAKIVANPWYAGHYAQRYKAQRGQRGHRMLPKEEYVLSPEPGDFEHPITLADWYETQEILAGRVHSHVGRKALLTGLIHCCKGQPMIGGSGELYLCHCKREGKGHQGGTASRERIDLWIQEIVNLVLEALPDAALVVPEPAPVRNRNAVEVELRQARTTLQERQKELTDLIRQSVRLSARFNSAEFEGVVKQVTAERDDAQKALDRLKTALDEPDQREVRTLLQRVRAVGMEVFWHGDGVRPAATVEEQRAVVQAVVKKITLDPIPEGRTTVRGATVELRELGQPKIKIPSFTQLRGSRVHASE